MHKSTAANLLYSFTKNDFSQWWTSDKQTVLYFFTPPGTVISVRLEQPSKAASSISSSASGRLMLFKDEQYAKAYLAILLSVEGNFIFLSEKHQQKLWKHKSSIPSGISISSNDVQKLNASGCISFRVEGSLIFFQMLMTSKCSPTDFGYPLGYLNRCFPGYCFVSDHFAIFDRQPQRAVWLFTVGSWSKKHITTLPSARK